MKLESRRGEEEVVGEGIYVRGWMLAKSNVPFLDAGTDDVKTSADFFESKA